MSEFPFPKEIALTMESTNRETIHQGNSIISVENLPEYAQPVVVKKPAKGIDFGGEPKTSADNLFS